MTFTRDDKAHVPPPPECRTCAHCIEWRSTTGDRYDCLRGYPMHPSCAWHSPRTAPIPGAPHST